MVITESFVDCYAAIPRMPQSGLRIPRAPRFLPPFGSSPNLMTQASQMRPLSSSMMMGPNIGPNHHHLGVGGGPMSQPGLFPSPHHMPQNLMPFPGMMKQGPPSIDSMIRSPHHPMSGPIFGQMHNMHHHHPQASHPPPSYHSKPSFYQNKPDDCPFPGCEMEPAYNGEPAVPQQQHSSPFSNNDSPMIPSLTAPDTIGQLDFQSRPPHHQEQFGGSRPSLIMPPQHQQQVKVVYKPVVKLVKIPVEVPVKVKQPYPVKVPVPVQVPFPVKVIQRKKIMFPIAVPFNSQVLPVAALVPKSQGINQDQQQQQQQQQIPQQQQQQQQYQPQQPMLKQPQAQSQYHGPGDYQKKLIQVNENGEPYGSQQQQSAIQQNIHPINLDENRFQNHQQQQFYYGNQDHQQQEHYRQQQQGNNQQQQQQYQQQQGNNQQQQQYQQQQGNNQQQQQYRPQQQQQKFRQEIVHVEGPNYRGISDISFGGQQQQQQQQRNNDNNNNNYDNHQQQQQPQGYSGYGYSSMNSDSQSNYNNNNNNDNRGPSTIGQMVQQQQNYNQQQQNWAQSNQQQQKPNFIVPPFDRNFIENYREREQEPEYLMRFLTNTQPQSQQQSSNYGNENNNNVAPYSRNNNNNNPPIYNDNGENSFINIDRGMAGWSPIRLSPSSHQMAESRISHDNHHDNIDDSERESVDSFLQDRIDNDVNEFEYDSSSHIDSIHRPVSIETPYVTGNLIRSPMYMSKFQKRS